MAMNIVNTLDNNTYYPIFSQVVGTASTVYISNGNGGNTGLNYNPNSGLLQSNSYNSYSDYRIKENVETLDSRYTTENLRPVTYINKISGIQNIGLIAHELHDEYPFLVTGDKDGKNIQSVNYTGLIGILINEIKELKKRVSYLETKI